MCASLTIPCPLRALPGNYHEIAVRAVGLSYQEIMTCMGQLISLLMTCWAVSDYRILLGMVETAMSSFSNFILHTISQASRS